MNSTQRLDKFVVLLWLGDDGKGFSSESEWEAYKAAMDLESSLYVEDNTDDGPGDQTLPGYGAAHKVICDWEKLFDERMVAAGMLPPKEPPKTDYFAGCANMEEITARYRQLCSQHHPDRGGNAEVMSAINVQRALH